MAQSIADGCVPIRLAEPGNRLDVETDDGERAGSTAAIPFIDPRKKGPRRLR